MTIVIVGAGGQARELLWTVEALGDAFSFQGFVVTDLEALTEIDSDHLVRGDYDWLTSERRRIDSVAIGIGSPGARRRVAEELDSLFPELDKPPLVHPSAVIAPGAQVGRGCYVAAGGVVSVGVTLGDFSMVNMNATVGHEAQLGVGAVVNPGANVGGGVTIGDGALVGSGAQVLQYRDVGERAIVGAGAVVTRDVGTGTTAIGIPARRRPARSNGPGRAAGEDR